MTPRSSMPDSVALTPTMFQILLALANDARHGYAIMQEIERRTEGAVELGAGTLYRSIRQLLEAGFIAEVHPRRQIHSQRRYYRITAVGRRAASAEARRLRNMVQWARAADVLGRRGA